MKNPCLHDPAPEVASRHAHNASAIATPMTVTTRAAVMNHACLPLWAPGPCARQRLCAGHHAQEPTIKRTAKFTQIMPTALRIARGIFLSGPEIKGDRM